MFKRLVISDHAMKHVDHAQEKGSIFVNIETMYQYIQECLNQPDTITKFRQRVKVTKMFGYTIELFNGNTIRIVYK